MEILIFNLESREKYLSYVVFNENAIQYTGNETASFRGLFLISG